MHRSFIALIIGSALALTHLGAAPAEARDRGETAAAVAGVAALALVAAAIAKRNRQDRRDQVARDQRDYIAQHQIHQGEARAPHRDRGHAAPRRVVGHGHDKGYRPERHVRLPGVCRVRNGQRTGYSGRCLRQYDHRVALPSDCALRVGGSLGIIYRDRCLNGYGYY